MLPTIKDANGFRVAEIECPKCGKHEALCREFSAHFAGLTQHVSGAWSLCNHCHYEWMSFRVTQTDLHPPLRGDHELVHAMMS